MQKKYIVCLTDVESAQLNQIAKKLNGTPSKAKRANILLKADDEGLNWTDYFQRVTDNGGYAYWPKPTGRLRNRGTYQS